MRQRAPKHGSRAGKPKNEPKKAEPKAKKPKPADEPELDDDEEGPGDVGTTVEWKRTEREAAKRAAR